MPRSAASDLGLYCLPMSDKKDARLKWVKSLHLMQEVFKVPLKYNKLAVHLFSPMKSTVQGFGAQLIAPIQFNLKRHNSNICKFFQDITWI